MKKALHNFFLGMFLISTISCESEEQTPRGDFANGIFIINEGNFTESNGSIGFINENEDVVETDLFERANEVKSGGIIQSVCFFSDKAYIIDQLGGRIEVVEAETFKSVATINEGLSTPRYMVVSNGKGYVTNWGNFDDNYDLPDSYIAVIDLDSYTVSKTIDSGNGSEGMIVFGENVFIANSYSNTIEVINTKTDVISTALTVSDSPVGFVEDKNGMVWVLSSSFFSGSALSKLDLASNEVLASITIGSSAKSLTINGEGDQLYYLSAPYGAEAEVKSVSIDAIKDASTALIKADNLYGLGVDPETDIIYLGNHNGFQGNGTVLRYNGSTFIDSFEAGVAPNGFVFRK